jgi:hypothetical protein
LVSSNFSYNCVIHYFRTDDIALQQEFTYHVNIIIYRGRELGSH